MDSAGGQVRAPPAPPARAIRAVNARPFRRISHPIIPPRETRLSRPDLRPRETRLLRSDPRPRSPDLTPRHSQNSLSQTRRGGDGFGRATMAAKTSGVGGAASSTAGSRSGAGTSGSARAEPPRAHEGTPARAYDPSTYAHLDVSGDIRELFQYIGRYNPPPSDAPTPLKPFVPDYVPAVGDVDEFVKVPRPDGRPDELGIRVLDEPAARQSDATVLSLRLRHANKQAGGAATSAEVRSVDKPEGAPEKLNNWIENVKSLHAGDRGAVASVSYSKNMPDVETLMEEWDPEVEEVLRTIRIPDETMGVDLRRQAKLSCAALDIPVYDNLVESLHVMFTTYLEFKNNPFLRQQRAGGMAATLR